MSQIYTDDLYTISMQAATTLQAMKDNFAALKSAFSGTSEPSNPIGGMCWLDTTNHLYKLRNEANNAWLSIWDMANNKPILTNAKITELPAAGAWKLFYSNGSNAIIELALGAPGTILKSNGTAAAPSFVAESFTDGSVTGAKLLQPTSAGTEIYLARATTQRMVSKASEYTKFKETAPLTRGGTVTVTFTLGTTDTRMIYGKVYKNGLAIGAERLHSGTWTPSETTYSENFTGVAIGDVFQVYCKNTDTGGAYVKDLFVTANDPYCVREASGY